MEIATVYKQMGFGGAVGLLVGMAVFVYVAGLVYGMSTPNGRKTLLGLGVLTILLGLACIMYWPEYEDSDFDVSPIWKRMCRLCHSLVSLSSAQVALMCKLGSLKD
ncbi:MAG: hypothetical protein ACJZ70_07695 [Limisphaerales bacterium]